MPSPKAVLCGALAAGVLWSAPAEARFGKHSSSSSSQSGGSRDHGGPRPSRPSGDERPRTHGATPISGRSSSNDDDDSPRRRRRVVVRRPLTEVIVSGAIIAAPPRARALAPVTRVRERYEPVPLMVRLGVEGGLLGDGGAMGVFMAVEGRRLGMDTRVTGIALPADDGSKDVDRITLLSAHITAALWAGPRGRVRVEAGVASAHAPDIIFVGPSFGASAEACIGRSPVDLEARLHATPFPHRQVDVQAGLATHLGALNLRGGWRGLYLNDEGHVDGIEHAESIGGPYLGLGLSF
ncbi:hypothetical protein JY651_44455 [Pyxidicoccus parkwayensis]|uniref:Outer membrane protein beta-barrel domain-containing protein n=1 Tax=Pyxidicoccus parkwayensis TaxID=2813578 RepID=A0ABX7NXB3_9BACT|nr:hypothetical protein [Pyxidicoccus parkwaysis]QSQ22117.1 hypothetical protein JY651_44455 [Pyxidicoccus parkwaysis]